MTKQLRLFFTMLLLTLLGSSATWAEDIGAGTFNGKNATYTEGWTTTGTGISRTDCVIIGAGENITSPEFDLSRYSEVTISIKARRYGTLTGSKATIDASIGGTSVGTTDATGTSATTSLTDITFTPTSGMTSAAIVFTCTNATSAGSTHGAGINSITITGTLASSSGKQTATVAIGETSLAIGESTEVTTDGPAVTLATSDASIASVSGTTVTGVAAGAATITATWSENDEFDGGSKEFTVTVTDPNAPGLSADNPYTVAQARAAIDAGTGVTGVYAKGIVSEIVTAYSSQFGNISYNISDDGTTTADQLEAYRGFSYNGAKFTSENDIQVGDEVVIYGDLTKYNSTYEFGSGNQLVSLVRTQQNPFITAEDVELEYDATSGTIVYSIENPSESAPALQATLEDGCDWISNIQVGETITFATTVNEGSANRSATITLTYEGAADKVVTVTQKYNADNVKVVIEEDDKTTFLFDSENKWELPTTKAVDEAEYTADGYTITVAGTSGNGYRTYGSYFLMGKQGAYLTLPAFDFPVSKIEVVGNSNASGSVKQNFFVGDEAVSTETTGAQETNTYEIAEDYQAAGNIYTLKVTSNHNTQLTQIIVYKGEEPAAQPKYYVVGYHNDWDNGEAVTDNLEMKRASDGTLKATVALGGTSTTGDFKIIKVEEGQTTAWYGATADGSYWVTADNHTDIPLVDGAANLHIETAGTYDFSLNVDDLTLTVTGWPEPKWYLAGSFATTDAWADDMVEFESQGDGIYTLTKELEANTELKVVNEGVDQWYSTNPAELTKENSSQGIQLSTDNGSNMVIAPAGTYTFTLDANTMTLSVTGWQIVLEGNFFVKVTSADELEDGAYLIVCEDAIEAGGDDAVLNGNTETIDSGSNFISVVSTNNTLIPATDDNKKAVFIISNGTIQSASQGYYIGATSNSNQIATSTTDAYGNNISIDEEGNAIITADFDGSNRTLGFYDQNGGRFRYYGPTSNAKAIQLYKLTTIEPVTVKLNKYGYATMYYGNLALTVPEGVTATTYTEDVEESTTYNAGDAIPAGEAVVLKGDANTEYTFELTTTDVDPDTNNALMGLDEAGTTVAPADGDYKFYMLSAKNGKVGFYYGTGCPNGEAFQTAAHKAYLVVPVAAGAKECYIFGETTGINSVLNAEFAEGSVYNLNGQRVDKNYKGVVIVNGKKLIKK